MKKKTVCWIVIIVLIIAGIFGYNRYMHGNLKIDRELVSDENLNLLADNWEKLDLDGPVSNDTDWPVLLGNNNSENIYAQVTINNGDPSEFDSFIDFRATYSRTSLMDILNDPNHYDLNSLHKSFNEIIISNSRIAILFWEFECEPNADTFEAWFRDQLEIAQS